MKVCRVAIIKQTNAKRANKEIKWLVLALNHYCCPWSYRYDSMTSKALLYMVLKNHPVPSCAKST